MERKVRRGEIYYTDFGCGTGSQQTGIRPALILQNDKGNLYSDTVIVAPITSRKKKLYVPTQVQLNPGRTALKKSSVVLLEQITTINKRQLINCLGYLPQEDLEKINNAICISMGITIKKNS